jgi:pimeloyl-ACP methyl ester carboxylesterase
MRKLALSLLRIFLLVVVAVPLLLFFFQHRLIYLPRAYHESVVRSLPAGVIELPFTTAQGKQSAFYLPPVNDGTPERLWVMFNGNGSLALEWLFLLDGNRPRRDGFLLVDFPGYGNCEGSASPEGIRDNASGALRALTAESVDAARPGTRLCAMGYSIGCGAALEFAAAHPVGKIVLITPFTSLADVARLRVGWPLCLLLRQNFDNAARLDEIARRTQPPRVDIFHGDRDIVVPQRMGVALAARHPQMIRFHPVSGAQHPDILDAASGEILRVMAEP